MSSNQPPPSPWKKPKVVSLGNRTKSLKRKSEIFNTLNSENNPSLDDSSLPSRDAKIGKTIFNRFSINRDSANFSFKSSEKNLPAEKDLFSFFRPNENISEESLPNQENKTVQKTNEKLSSLNPEIIQNICFSNGSTGREVKQAPVEKKVAYDFESEKFLPVDWSLKTKLRFISTKPFSCNNAVKSQHESEGIQNYSKFNLFYQNLNEHKYNSKEQNQNLFKTLFNEALNYWTFPYFPWLNLFPRNMNFSNLSTETMNPEKEKILSKSWNTSFKSLYNSLKSNQCPYFYVLTHSFVVLFKAQNIGGTEEMTAILTPSTKGLRQTLEQDINFSMPLAPANHGMKKSLSGDLKTNDSSNSNDNETKNSSLNQEENENLNVSNHLEEEKKKEDDEDEENDDDFGEPDEWLQEMGIDSQVNFKASILQRNSKNAQKDALYNFDNRPRSALLFSEGADVQALFNFLLNAKQYITTSSGPLAGIPPTLLAPLPFIGGTLQKIKIEQNVIKSLNSQGEPVTQYAIDLIGPIMPYHVHRLCSLFRITQVDNFSMVANIYDQSQALNCAKKQDNKPGMDPDSGTTSYLDLSEAKSLEVNYGVYGESQYIKSIDLIENKFCCSYPKIEK